MTRATTRRSQIDVDRVRETVEAAERTSSAEIVVSIAPFFLGRVWTAARRAFARLGLARTRGSNGVLVFVVPSRRQVVVLADDGALACVDPSVWTETATRIAAAFARGDGTAGLVDGIERLARALSAAFPHQRDDVNELADQPHLGAATLHGMRANEPRLTEIRGELLRQHASLRSLAERLQEVAKRSPSARTRKELARLLRALAEAVDAHNRREEDLLADVTPRLDAWGDVRAARMAEHHQQEHRRLEEAIRAAAETQDPSSAHRLALTAIDDLLEHLHGEETDLVNPDVLRDDIVIIGQSDG